LQAASKLYFSIMYNVSSIEKGKAVIKSFIDLNAWKTAHKLALDVYKVTNKFSVPEQYGLTSQIRRSAVSVPSNIAEGFSRRSRKDKIQFYTFASGSLTELQSQLILARDLKFLQIENFDKLAEESVLCRN
jgi:four helix bundle protein